jgi:hypothetical protein
VIKVVWNISLSFFTFFSSNHEPKTHSKHQTNDVFFARVEFAKDDGAVFVSGKPLSAFFSLITPSASSDEPVEQPYARQRQHEQPDLRHERGEEDERLAAPRTRLAAVPG